MTATANKKQQDASSTRIRAPEDAARQSSPPPPPSIISGNERADSERARHSRSSSAEASAANEPLVFVPQRQRNAVSRREDDTDNWGIDELDTKEEHRLVLRDSSLKSTILSRLNTFRRNRELCDVILFVREREIIAHKVVLAAISPALYNMFNAETSEPEKVEPVKPADDPKQSAAGATNAPANSRSSVGPASNPISYFEFNQGDFGCFEALVEFAYSGVLSISNLKIADLYKTAFALQVDSVAQACAQYLAENLSYGNCIGIRRHANFNNDTFLVSRVDTFIEENFEKILNESVEFTKLPCIKTRIIVPHNGEEQIDDTIAARLAEKTIAYFQNYAKISERVEQQIEALTQKSHLLFVEADGLTLEDCSKVNETTTLGSSEVVKDYKRAIQQRSQKSAGHNSQPIGAPTIPHHVTGALPVKINASRVANAKYASHESLNSLASSATDVEDEIESKLISIHLASPGFWIALSVLYKRLVVLSIQLTDDENLEVAAEGKVATPPFDATTPKANNNNSTNGVKSVVKRSAESPQPSLLAKITNNSASLANEAAMRAMSTARCSVGAVFLNGKIIVAGGYDRGECLKSVEEYDLETRTWQSLPPMKTERGRFDASVIDGKLYAVAGSNGNNDLQTVECFDPQTRRWTSITPLNKARSHNACASLDGFIYCCGGALEQKVLRDCERFNSVTAKWEPISPMQTARCQSGCATWKGLIVVCAGSNNWNCLDSVEAYDPKTDTWRLLAKLNTPRRGCAVAVLKDVLYVIGGHDGTQSLRSVEFLTDICEQWRPGPSLNIPRANTHAVTANNAIYVIGGFDGTSFLPSLEVLDASAEPLEWRHWVQPKRSTDKESSAPPKQQDGSTTAGAVASEQQQQQRAGSVTPRAAATIAVQ